MSTSDSAAVEAVREELAGSFKGELLSAGDAGYEEARQVWNAMVDKRPGLIARCADRDDVVAVVNASRRHDTPLSVRAGGHGIVGSALAGPDGVTCDMTGMRGVEVDLENKVVHVQGGCKLGDVDAATAAHGLAVPAGIVSDTGVPGLALGGGIGWLSRKHGLTCDNFASLEVVTAAGEVIEVSEDSHPDLFWALRGGGNFGVVTRFSFKAYEFGPTMRFGAALYKEDEARVALREYARIYPTLPNNVGWHVAMKREMPPLPFVPEELVGTPLVMLFCMWLDDPEAEEGVETVERLTAIGEPAATGSAVIPFGLGMQRFLDAEFPDGLRNYTKEGHLTELSEGAIDALVDFWAQSLGPATSIEGELAIYGLGGVARDVPEDASAFSNRDSLWWINWANHWHDAADDEANMETIRASYRSVEPWLGRGVYVNMLNVDELDRVVEAYGGPEKYARLGRVKAQYDPENLFRMNHNIKPVEAAGAS